MPRIRQVLFASPIVVLALLITLGSATAFQSPRIVYRPTVVLQLGVANLDRAIKFYEGTLEFEVTERRDDLKFAHVRTNVPGLELGLSESPKPGGSGTVVVNISVADVAEARRLLESRGVVFKGPTQVIPGKVALAAFADPDGHTLRLAGPPPKTPMTPEPR